MIPKKIHYIWLGKNKMPKVFEKCLASWKKFCPDFEIKRWDESNIDLDKYSYARQAYDAKKFAFASDVIRFDILHNEGGVYLDIDVELIGSIDEFLASRAFFGFESKTEIAPGLICGAEKGLDEFEELLKIYQKEKFILENGKMNLETICTKVTNFFKTKGLKANNTMQEINGIKFYPSDFFNPINVVTHKMKITKNTRAIHYFCASWYTPAQKFKHNLKKVLNICSFGLFGKLLDKTKKKQKN